MAAISRANQLKQLLPGLNALFGEEYNNYDSVSVNTKTKVKRAIKQRYNELDEVKPSKKAAKKLKSKKTKK